MLVIAKKMLNDALNRQYAICQFNINNLEWARFILEECKKYNTPVILGVCEGATKYMGGYKTVVNMVKGLIEDLNITIPVCIHLDHGSSIESCKKAIDAGYTSVMIDASRYTLEVNIKMTKEVVEYAKKYRASVESEIVHICGAEVCIEADILYAEVEDCVKLVQETNINFLAPALGSVHGFYKGEPKLNFERMQELKEKLKMPLVLHGGTGIPDDKVKKAIECGICKININTELQTAWSEAVRKYLFENFDVYDPRKIIKAGEKAMKEVISMKIELVGSANKR